MIPFEFAYYLPQSLAEAVSAFERHRRQDRPALYYGGGSEIITMSRAGSLSLGAVIDIKSIPECLVLEKTDDALVIGAANSLTRIKDSGLFPLLGKACGRVADHTNQCRITLGGNLSGTIRYRETSLPLLITGATALMWGPDGARREAFGRVFDGRMRYRFGEFLVQIEIPAAMLALPFAHIKKTAGEKIDYPLVNVTAVLAGGRLRVALSGVCRDPVRSLALEDALNDAGRSPGARVEAALQCLPEPVTDSEAGGAYRRFVLKNTLQNLLAAWESGALEGQNDGNL